MLSAKISIISLENSAVAISFGKIIEIGTEIILNSMREKPIIQVINNTKPFAIVESRELSRGSKSKFVADSGIVQTSVV